MEASVVLSSSEDIQRAVHDLLALHGGATVKLQAADRITKKQMRSRLYFVMVEYRVKQQKIDRGRCCDRHCVRARLLVLSHSLGGC